MHVAIIGAGPRGLVELQRLVEWQRQTKRFERLQVTVIDPYGVGGRVWQIDQPHALLMNTNPNNVTLFADHTDQITGPIVTGPDLYDWTQRDARDFIVEHAPAQSAALLAEIARFGRTALLLAVSTAHTPRGSTRTC
ncbi:FAD/NAD(P)-binding protein [Lacticaseibacillus pantheris]|uniref:FAD/NAD(P)-binding protein n=1 Tax=Lacticaseibacillus pantheris TaxID=171523 RepID=UPI0006D13CCB|nr:FAD/NAD(P)-binding protein [Lacticaseibacillus pantheris]